MIEDRLAMLRLSTVSDDQEQAFGEIQVLCLTGVLLVAGLFWADGIGRLLGM